MMGPALEIAHMVLKQLSSYNYTFPSDPHVHLTWGLSYLLTLSQGQGAGLVRHSQLCHNNQIITVIYDLYFSGFPTTFAEKFKDHFLLHQGDDAKAHCEVPILMVALVATKVSLCPFCSDQYLHSSLAVCHSLQVAYGCTEAHWVFNGQLSGCLPRPLWHFEAHFWEPWACVSCDDEWYIQAGDVTEFISLNWTIWMCHG